MCGGSKGQQRTQQTTTTQATPEAMAAYQNILSRAQQVAETPYQAYTGERVAGFTPYQEQAFQQIAGAQQAGMGTLGTAEQMARTGAAPISAEQIQSAMNPYQQAVVQSTMDEMMRQEAMQQSALKGQAISAGAFGGDRAGVAAAELARNQEQVRAKTLASLMQQGYSQAVAQAQADRTASQVGAGQTAALAQQEQAMPLAATQALLGAGTAQQQLAQQQLNVPYQTYLEQRAYPFQTAQWLAGLATGVGGAMGGTSQSQGVQTPPQPNPLNAILGLGLGVAGLGVAAPAGAAAGTSGGTLGGNFLANLPNPFKADGGRVDDKTIDGTAVEIPKKADGGGLGLPAPSGMPYGGGFIPAATLQARPLQIAQAPLQWAKEPENPAKQFIGQAMDLAKSIRDNRKTEMPSAASWEQGTTVTPAATGGRIHMADGGMPGGTSVEPITEGRDVGAAPGMAAAEYTSPPQETPAGGAPEPMPGRMGLGAAGPSTSAPAPQGGGFELSPEARQAMMQAGFALMASRSPWLGQAIGEAGMTGTQAYAEAQKVAEARRKQLEAEKIQRERMEKDLRPTNMVTQDNIEVYFDPHKKQLIDPRTMRPIPPDTKLRSLSAEKVDIAANLAQQKIAQAEQRAEALQEKLERGNWKEIGIDADTRRPILRNQITGEEKLGVRPEGVKEVISPPTKEEEEAKKVLARETSKIKAQATAALPSMENSAGRAMKLIEDQLSSGDYKKVVGFSASFPTVFPTSQTIESKLKQISDGAFVQAFESLRGAGPISNVEGQSATNALTRLRNLKQDDLGYKEALEDFYREIQNLQNVVRKKAGLEPLPVKIPTPAPAEKAAASTAEPQPSAPSVQLPPPEQREAGKTYPTPRGPMKWTGTGWVTP